MKNEFELAFNEVAETLKLSKEVVTEALETALVSAYRRNSGASSAQNVEVTIDDETGQLSIFVEKEVSEDVQDDRTEVSLENARLQDADAQVGDMLMVEAALGNFGRIAAQTAKQVLLQRMREAERAAQYEEYRERVGDLVTGTVQSVSDSAVTVGLGRSEAILPRSQQVPGERYHTHDKVRAYVMEVRESSRGPQIILSRAHRNMLRRLLEYEVPEIYNGTVEIKNIAREPGARSKVAVFATQEGVDPVGACVGIRGVRIQSIVRELSDEKIDVIEWNIDQSQFIAKALSPARVTNVFLDEDLNQGRTAIVIVPDDQLSLAIGREGQNARLAAKLTGWRIDIKSITESANDALAHIAQPELAELAAQQAETIAEIERIMAKKAANRPVMPEEYQALSQFSNLVEGNRLGQLQVEREAIEEARVAVREQIPPNAYQFPLEETSIPLRIYNILAEDGFTTFGDVMEQVAFDEDYLLNLAGFGEKALETLKDVIETEEIPEPELEPEPEEVEVVEVEAAEEAAEVAEVEGEAVAEVSEAVAAEEPVIAEAEAVAEVKQAPASEAEPVKVEAPPKPVVAKPAAQVFDEDVLDQYLGTDEAEEKLAKEKAKRRRQQLVFDEDLGEVVVKRRRKASRSRAEWENFDGLDDLDELDIYDEDEDVEES